MDKIYENQELDIVLSNLKEAYRHAVYSGNNRVIHITFQAWQTTKDTLNIKQPPSTL